MIHIMLLNLFRTERLLFYQDVYFIKKILSFCRNAVDLKRFIINLHKQN